MTDPAVANSAPESATVGPNAILQYLPVLQTRLGETGMVDFFEAEHLDFFPDGTEMIAEEHAARFHQAVLRSFPDKASDLARDAGGATADYIIANRIPKFARAILALLPRPVAENMLCRSIAEHAWTFAGSGVFKVDNQSSIAFEIRSNPIVLGMHTEHPVCDWHVAVFERLFSRLIGGGYNVVETSCCAMGDSACRFELQRQQRADDTLGNRQ